MNLDGEFVIWSMCCIDCISIIYKEIKYFSRCENLKLLNFRIKYFMIFLYKNNVFWKV